MAFKSYENEQNQTMAEGDYECILVKCCETSTKSTGVPIIAFDFQVREDVEQRYKRKHIFKNFYVDPETNNWPMEKIGRFANALGVPKDAEFELEDLIGKCCILHMRPFTGNDGVARDAIFYTAPTKVGQLVTTLPTAEAGYVEVEDDEEMPF